MFVLYSFPYPVDRPGVGITAWERVTQHAQHGISAHLYYYGTLEQPLLPSVEAHEIWAVEMGRLVHHAPGDIAALKHQSERLATDREEYTGVRDAGLAQRPPSSCDHAGEVLVAAYRRAVDSELLSPRATAA